MREEFSFEYYLNAALATVSKHSRTAKGGTVDTSFSGGSSEKPKGIISDQDEMKATVYRNVEECVGMLYEQRTVQHTPNSFKTLMETIAERAVRGTITPRDTVYRTHEIDPGKGYGCPVSEIPQAMELFSLFGSMAYNVRVASPRDLDVLQGILEKTFDKDIHPLADACGRVSKLGSLGLAMRNNMPVHMPPETRPRYDTMGPHLSGVEMFSPESAEGLIKHLSGLDYF